MNLRELKKMIAEEYRYWLAEQPAGEPGVEVAPDDIDAMGDLGGGEDSEATLRQIYDMLKAYFEGGAGGPAGGAAGDPEPMGGDMDMADMGDMGDMGDMDAVEAGGDDDVAAGDEDDEEAEALQERFKKLANIIKG